MRRQGWRQPRRGRWFAPGAGIAARDHPVDEASDDSRTGHDFEMAPDDAIEAKRCGVERDQAEIARQTDRAAADRVGQRAPDVKRLGDRDHDHRRQQGKTADEDEAEAEHDVQRAGIDRTGAEIAEFRKQHRAYHDHSRHQTRGEKSEQNHEQAADQRHVAKSISKSTNTNLSTVMPGHSSLLFRRLRKLVCDSWHPRLASSKPCKTWMTGTSPAMTNSDALSASIRHRHGAQRLALAHRQFLGFGFELAAGGKDVAPARRAHRRGVTGVENIFRKLFDLI